MIDREYTAEIDKNLIGGEWFVRVRYVANPGAARRRWASFVFIPSHQGEMFFEVCESIEPALEAYVRMQEAIA